MYYHDVRHVRLIQYLYTIIKSSENYRLRELTNLSFVEEQKSRKVIYINIDTFPENRTDNFLSYSLHNLFLSNY